MFSRIAGAHSAEQSDIIKKTELQGLQSIDLRNAALVTERKNEHDNQDRYFRLW